MPQSPPIPDVSRSEFQHSVIEASRSIPVLVDFWAAWCQPCLMLAPVLEQIAADYAGRISVVKVDTDREPELAGRFGVRSLPAVKLFRGGEVAAEFSGVLSPGQVKAFLEQHLPRDSDDFREQAEELRRQDRLDEAIALLSKALDADPENHRIHPALAELLIDASRLDEAEQVIKTLPANLQQEDAVVALVARLRIARTAGQADAPEDLEALVTDNPDDLDARYRLSALQIMRGDYEPAMENLMEILRRDRSFRDDAARRTLVDVFTMLDNRGPLVKRYRTLLSSELN